MKNMSNAKLGGRAAGSAVTVAALVVGFSLQACGGAPDSQGQGQGQATQPGQPSQPEQTATSKQDLNIFGFQFPEPTITVAINDAGVTIDPLGVIDELLPPIKIDPISPVNNLINTLDKPLGIGVTAGGAAVGVEIPGLQLPTIPNPFPDGGITIIGP
jgi:hypothetical protein